MISIQIPNYPDYSHTHDFFKTGIYLPNFPKCRLLNKYDGSDTDYDCLKIPNFGLSDRVLMIFNCLHCQKNIGFAVLNGSVSPLQVFKIIMTRLPNPPCTIIHVIFLCII